jgi:short-subunit dehydrogenase
MKEPASILITGASGGIGGALAQIYARPGVVLTLGGRNRVRLDKVVQSCRNAGAEVHSATIDVTDEIGMRRWVEEADDQQPIDLAIANAGMTGGHGPDGAPESLADVERMMKVNFAGVCHTLLPLIPAMRRRRRGQLALVSSLAAIHGLPYSPAYCASKAAVKAYGEALGTWLSADGMEVSVILPGFVDTTLSRHVTGPKPLQMSAERAAHIIRRGLRRGQRVIAFPFPLYAGVRLLSILPAGVADAIMAAVPVTIRRYE